jgi:hypothetical protein
MTGGHNTNSGRDDKGLCGFEVFVMLTHVCIATAILISMVMQ